MISNTIISKTKEFFLFFCCILEMCMKFRAFQKKDEYPSLIISEIIDAERCLKGLASEHYSEMSMKFRAFSKKR